MASTTLNTIMSGFAQMSSWEITAALMGVMYILLAAKPSQWCWPFAFLSTVIYTFLFWEGQLPMQALLNFYYIGMALYGYWLWRQHGKTEDALAITSWGWVNNLGFIAVGLIISAIVTDYLSSSGQSQSPALDAYTTVFAVMNTWLMAKKILQNWLYWVMIDAVAVVLYVQTSYYATAALFVLNTILAIAGYISWVKQHQQQMI
ncbi:MAG: nicotinamide riboside transporter PnuC [Methylophilaceae bacterium]|nr:nicotinamide riboside transporter PnuC [Methylophilaceae bacterium]MDG2292990.1 nicotinamide riboside transporter PnuC [Methylophilaceae bacterium]